MVSGSAPAPAAESTPIPGALPEAIAIEKMSTTIRHYGSRFNGNPVGTNAEITRALNGANPAHVRFLDDQTDHINSAGELVDQWGTPYFFHQLSGHEMEIRSAGPDRKMYTGDDLISR